MRRAAEERRYTWATAAPELVLPGEKGERIVKGFVGACVVAAFTACGAAQIPAGQESGMTALSQQRKVAQILPHYFQEAVHTDHGKSWMLPNQATATLMYVSDWAHNDVLVYNYTTGEHVGTLTGFAGPYGMCVDATGDVYVTNANGDVTLEYAHGGVDALHIYDGGGVLMGCAVNTKGDLAVTSVAPGEVFIYPRGNPNIVEHYNNSLCGAQYTMAYDPAGDLIGVGGSLGVVVCGKLVGASKMTILKLSGITIYYPGGSMWDGKYIALGSQRDQNGYRDGIWPSRLSNKELYSQGEIVLERGGAGGYINGVNPFILGTKNTPLNRQQGQWALSPGEQCKTGRFCIVEFHYPSGSQAKVFSLPSGVRPAGVAVSIGSGS